MIKMDLGLKLAFVITVNSCLENPMDTGAWWATLHGVAEELNTT